MTFVYIIGREQGPCKFGMSDNPTRRMADLQPGCPFHLSVLHVESFATRALAYEAEQVFVRAWGDRRLRGEWFAVTGDEARGVLKLIGEEGP